MYADSVMGRRALRSGTLLLGNVAVPFRVYAVVATRRAREVEQVHAACGGRVRAKQRLVCSTCSDQEVSRSEIVRRFEHGPNLVVDFSEAEIKAIDAGNDEVRIAEFVPDVAVSPLYIERSYHVGPGPGGDQAFEMLLGAMRRRGCAAVGQEDGRQLVVLRALGVGMVMHVLSFGDEILDESGVSPPEGLVSSALADAADRLVERLFTSAFDPTKYRDESHARLVAAAEEKARGGTIGRAAQHQAAAVNIFDAVLRSLDATGAGPAVVRSRPISATPLPAAAGEPSGDGPRSK